MSHALNYLLRKQWSMGNGQCPDCYGASPDWLGHPLHMTPESIGHKPRCAMASALSSLGVEPVIIGSFVPTEEQIAAAAPRLERSMAMQEAFTRMLEKAFFNVLMGAGR